jgi:tetratricopeptide (TPR) repeat protein
MGTLYGATPELDACGGGPRFHVGLHVWEENLAATEKALGANHPDTAKALSQLAMACPKERSAEAVKLYRRALSIQGKVLGANHPDLAETLDGLAMAYFCKRRHKKEAECRQRAVAIREKAFGAHDSRVADTCTGWPAFVRDKPDIPKRRGCICAR